MIATKCTVFGREFNIKVVSTSLHLSDLVAVAQYILFPMIRVVETYGNLSRCNF